MTFTPLTSIGTSAGTGGDTLQSHAGTVGGVVRSTPPCSQVPIQERSDVLASLGYRRPSWQSDALCKEYQHLAWFAVRGQSCAPALLICERCCVRPECRTWALADPSLDHAGVLGGQSARVRVNARRSAMKQTNTPPNEGDPDAQE